MQCITRTEVFASSSGSKSSITLLPRVMWRWHDLKMLPHRCMSATGSPEVSEGTEILVCFCIVTVDPPQSGSFGWVLRLPPQRAAQVSLLFFATAQDSSQVKCCAWIFECICLEPAWIKTDLPEPELAGPDVSPWVKFPVLHVWVFLIL